MSTSNIISSQTNNLKNTILKFVFITWSFIEHLVVSEKMALSYEICQQEQDFNYEVMTPNFKLFIIFIRIYDL